MKTLNFRKFESDHICCSSFSFHSHNFTIDGLAVQSSKHSLPTNENYFALLSTNVVVLEASSYNRTLMIQIGGWSFYLLFCCSLNVKHLLKMCERINNSV